jgi:outer membrane protein TolC
MGMCLALVSINTFSFGQELDLMKVLEQSKHNYPLLNAKQAEVLSAERRVKSANTEYLPNLTLQHQYTYSTNNSLTGAFFPNEGTALSPSGGIRPDNIYQGVWGSFTSSLFEWRVFNFGKVALNVKVAKSDYDRSQADYENELFQHQIRVIDSYLLLLISRKLTQIQVSNFKRAEIFKRVVESGVNSGLRPGVDSSLASAEYAKAKLLLLESERNEKVQNYRLTELMGALQDSIIIDSMNFYSSLPVLVGADGHDFQKNPVLRLHQSHINLSQARSKAIKRSFLPSVSLIGSAWARGSGVSNKDDAYRTDFASGVDYQVFNYLFGISTRWNLTNYARVRNDYKGEQFQVEKFRHLYNEQNLKLNRQVKESDMQFHLMLQQAALAPLQLEAGRAAYGQAQARYENGLADLPTLTQSLIILNRAEIDQYIAYGNSWRALLSQAAAKGDLSLFLDQIK